MVRARENILLFLYGGMIYSLMEILFRGFTHWSMTITGGVCLIILYRHFEKNPNESIVIKCLFGAAVITALEFTAGCIVNLWLGWNVWDYSALPFNFMGQVCLLFSALWFLITVPALWICKGLKIRFASS